MPKGKKLTAQQIMDTYAPGDKLAKESADQFWNSKLEEAHILKVSKDRSLYEDVKQHGQKKPILLTQGGPLYTEPTIIDGHHRLALMHHINPQQFVKYRHIQDR